MTTPEASLAAATLAMTVVKNEANDNYGTWTWTVEQGAERFLEVMRNEGYALTPLAPEVPPRRDGLREALTEYLVKWKRLDQPDKPLAVVQRWAEWYADQLAAARTPEPPDSGPGWPIVEPTIVDHSPFGEAVTEPPDSGDGAAPVTSSDIDKNAVNVPSRMRLMGKFLGGAAKEELDGMADLLDRAEPRDAGIDAALLAEAIYGITPPLIEWTGRRDEPRRWNEVSGNIQHFMVEEAERVISEYARLRSGSPAPEGGE